ncbi:hypothetical protein Bhyg_04418 [Pseudolycoriella hygida]|uniref:MARVEL domain-containing protein n=1 Tax=Pseudolycoriella hygida TaxID=35572 RepID=A0A9Q0NF73_9DIPT|nr:hypothetical protein Bhyg_04418 [Pseudolycoriella hygida]
MEIFETIGMICVKHSDHPTLYILWKNSWDDRMELNLWEDELYFVVATIALIITVIVLLITLYQHVYSKHLARFHMIKLISSAFCCITFMFASSILGRPSQLWSDGYLKAAVAFGYFATLAYAADIFVNLYQERK